jgi:hypothetical protein
MHCTKLSQAVDLVAEMIAKAIRIFAHMPAAKTTMPKVE